MNKTEAKRECERRHCNGCYYNKSDKRRDFEKTALGVPCWANLMNDFEYSTLVNELYNQMLRETSNRYSLGDVVGYYRLIKRYSQFDLWEKRIGNVKWKEAFPRNVNPMKESEKENTVNIF